LDSVLAQEMIQNFLPVFRSLFVVYGKEEVMGFPRGL
jgi:hypothetical protein